MGTLSLTMPLLLRRINEFKIKSLLRNKKIRKYIESLKEVNIQISNQKGIWEEQLPEKELELSLFINGELEDVRILKSLLYLFMEMLDELYQLKIIL